MNLQQFSLGVFYTLVFPGFLFAAVVGLFLTWVDRKVAAVVQSRVGPPWFQPYADIGKLLDKKMLLPRGSSAVGFVAAPILAVAGATLVSVIILRVLFAPTAGFVGDLVVLIYLTTLPAIALIIGGASSRSPFGAIGAGREMSMILAYEVGFLLAIITVLVKVKSIMLGDIIAYQVAHGAIALSLSGVIALVVILFCIQAKLGFLPFDIGEADSEIIGGPLAEYSGVGLALFKLAGAMMFFVLPVFVVMLFMGAVEPTPVSIVGFLVKLLAVLVVMITVKITHARLRLDQALRLFWGAVAIAGLIAVALALLGW
ncbi:NADH-quinone oxidoreductase subunit H [Anaerolineae bacterium]|nr:NADH-quinone oxidoreductase subunit H [Anaerolineae bacterium]